MNQTGGKVTCSCDAWEQVTLAPLRSRGGPHLDLGGGLISEERQTEESNKSNQVETDGWMGGPTQPSSNQPGDGDGWSRTKREGEVMLEILGERARGDATAVCSCCRVEETGGVRRKKTTRRGRGAEDGR